MADPAPLRILIVDDDTFVRNALTQYVEAADDMRVVGTCENGGEAIDQALATEADVVIMDIRMPVMDGIQAATRILARRPQAKVLMLTSFDEDDAVRAALGAGAIGFLLKSSTPEALLDAIRSASQGTSVVTPQALRRVVLASRPPTKSTVRLTASERQVLTLLCKGQTNPQIAAALDVSESTVKQRISALGTKLGTHTRVATAIRALELGVVDTPPREDA